MKIIFMKQQQKFSRQIQQFLSRRSRAKDAKINLM